MNFIQNQNRKFLVLTTAIGLLAGCGENQTLADEFLTALNKSLAADVDDTATATSLAPYTAFEWTEVCFNRNGDIKARFKNNDRVITSLSFPFEQVFIDDSYVYTSPAGKCLTPDDQFVIRRRERLPGQPPILEIQLTEAVAARFNTKEQFLPSQPQED